MRSDDKKPEDAEPGLKLPTGGDEILREVERLKSEPIQFRCLGMSLGTLVLVALLIWLLWQVLR
jgi:hypothetical protein